MGQPMPPVMTNAPHAATNKLGQVITPKPFATVHTIQWKSANTNFYTVVLAKTNFTAWSLFSITPYSALKPDSNGCYSMALTNPAPACIYLQGDFFPNVTNKIH